MGGLSNFNEARAATDLEVLGNVILTNSTGDIQLPLTGFNMVRSSGDANYNVRVRDSQGIWEFKNRKVNCWNPSNDAQGTELVRQETPNNDNGVRIGTVGGRTRASRNVKNRNYW